MRSYGVPILLITLILLTAYLPSYSFCYFVNDDFKLATSLGTDCRSMVFWKWNLKLGRPLASFAHCGALAAIPSLRDFWIGHLLSVMTIIAISCSLYIFFIQNNLGANWALLLSVSISTLPGMIYASTLLAAIPTLLGILCSIIGMICFIKCTDPGLLCHHRKYLLYIIGIASCILAVFTYQISLMIVVSLLSIPLISNNFEKKRMVKLTLIASLSLFLIVTIYLIWYIGSGNLARLGVIAYGQRPHSYLKHIAWYANEVLPRATTCWFINAPTWAGWCTYSLLTVFLILPAKVDCRNAKHQKTSISDLVIRLVFILIAPLICCGPLLVTNSEKVLFRTLIPLSTLILILGYLAIAQRCRPAIDKINSLPIGAVLGILWPLAFFTAWTGLTADVYSQASELRYMVKTVQAQTSVELCSRHLHFVQPEDINASARKLNTDEFYKISTIFGEGFYPSIGKVVYSLAGIPGPEIVSSSRPGEPYISDVCTVVLDMQTFARSLVW